MYLDRTLPNDVLSILEPSAPLGWLVESLCKLPQPWPLAHVQFRRNRRNERKGCISLYFGRTSPIRFHAVGRGMFRLEADAVYKVLSPALFAGARAAAELGRQRCVIEAHLSRVKEWLNTQPSFITKEAIVHAGLMRRYGHGNRIGDSFVAVDTEIVFEFPSRPTREHFNTTLCTGVRLAQGVGIPTELDTLGVLDAGDVAVVEVKDHARDVVGAASQVAAHVFRFRYHAGLKSVRPLDMIAELCRQKASVGLLPKHVEKVVPRANFVPVIAAPDGRNDWVEIWRQETQKVRDDNPALLNGLRFWRLESEEPNNGEILEEVVA